MGIFTKLLAKLGYTKSSAVIGIIDQYDSILAEKSAEISTHKIKADKLQIALTEANNTIVALTKNHEQTQLELLETTKTLQQTNAQVKKLQYNNNRLLQKQKQLRTRAESSEKALALLREELTALGINEPADITVTQARIRTLEDTLQMKAVYTIALENWIDQHKYGFAFSSLESLYPRQISVVEVPKNIKK